MVWRDGLELWTFGEGISLNGMVNYFLGRG